MSNIYCLPGRAGGFPDVDKYFIIFDVGDGPSLLLKCQITNAAGDTLTSSLKSPITERTKVKIRPNYVVLSTGDTFKFGYHVTGVPEAPLRWQVVQPNGGVVDDQGSYRAPSTPGYYSVRLTLPQAGASSAKASLYSPGVSDNEAMVKVVDRPQGTIDVTAPLRHDASWAQACVDQRVGMTYRWEITGGTAITGQNSSCLQFIVGSGPSLTLICRIFNEAGASLELSRTVNISPAKD